MIWYEGKTGNHQGLVIDEETGRNVAVAYDKADAPLIAAAPDLLLALQELALRTEQYLNGSLLQFPAALLPQVKEAIAKAKGAQHA